MKQEERTLVTYLKNIGLTYDEGLLYLTLLKQGESTTLELSRAIFISRTQVYRLLENLKQKGFIDEIIDSHTTRVRVSSTDRIDAVVSSYAQEAEKIKNELPQIQQLISGFVGSNQKETKVLFYRGQSGLQQLAWNALRSRDEFRGYSYRLWEEAIGEDFARKWFREAIRRDFHMRELYSDIYKKSVRKKKRLADDPEFKAFHCESRYISSEVLNIEHQIDIYNDVVAFYNWFEGEVFGVEIYNSKIARLQKQLFDIVWDKCLSQ